VTKEDAEASFLISQKILWIKLSCNEGEALLQHRPRQGPSVRTALETVTPLPANAFARTVALIESFTTMA
jgi:hypothetical protein